MYDFDKGHGRFWPLYLEFDASVVLFINQFVVSLSPFCILPGGIYSISECLWHHLVTSEATTNFD